MNIRWETTNIPTRIENVALATSLIKLKHLVEVKISWSTKITKTKTWKWR